MRRLIDDMIASTFGSKKNYGQHDSAVLSTFSEHIAFTTDSYVVQPLFFPGGDIGKLAVYGTVNDLAMSGARPVYMSVGFILEEGLPMETLWQIIQSMKSAADNAGIAIVTGDTKVVERGKGDGIYINTAGIGIIDYNLSIEPKTIQTGDAIILSGDLGRHGIAVIASRQGLEFETDITTDCAPLWKPVETLLNEGIQIHCLRDLTRGGLASALVEISEDANLTFEINESEIKVTEAVQSACELLGYDPLYVANEGRMVVFVPQSQSTETVILLKQISDCQLAGIVGSVVSKGHPLVSMRTAIGSNRIIDMLSGEQLPRIC